MSDSSLRRMVKLAEANELVEADLARLRMTAVRNGICPSCYAATADKGWSWEPQLGEACCCKRCHDRGMAPCLSGPCPHDATL